MELKHRTGSVWKKAVISFLAVLLVLGGTAPVEARAAGKSISIDGYMDDWDGLPGSYEYNWDNSANCWYWGVWVDGQCYKTPVGEYSTDVRHYIQLYRDEAGVYLHIVFSRDYWNGFNGYDYQFTFDRATTKFQIADESGRQLDEIIHRYEPGHYSAIVKHGDSQHSFNNVVAGEAALYVPEDRVNRELELFIPYESFNMQNPRAEAENASRVTFFTPNLMYRRINAEGAPTGAVISAAAGLGMVGMYFASKTGKLGKRKKNK
ncbi:MAG: hypothetical protein J6A77_09455 [Lachnospiraceae bacterium]|nr:hypothetical protein [Lachnospiraceae bacterium]